MLTIHSQPKKNYCEKMCTVSENPLKSLIKLQNFVIVLYLKFVFVAFKHTQLGSTHNLKTLSEFMDAKSVFLAKHRT